MVPSFARYSVFISMLPPSYPRLHPFYPHLHLAVPLRPLTAPSTNGRPAINLDGNTGDVRRAATRKEQHQAGKVLGRADAARGLSAHQLFRMRVEAIRRHAAGEDAGADGIDGDVQRRELRRRDFGQVDEGRL
jgi:hypothetical protein